MDGGNRTIPVLISQVQDDDTGQESQRDEGQYKDQGQSTRGEDFFTGHSTYQREADRSQIDRPCLIVEEQLEVLEEGATQYHGLVEFTAMFMIALVCLNQKIAFRSKILGVPLLKQSFPRDRVPNIVVELDSEKVIWNLKTIPDKFTNLLFNERAGFFEVAPVIVAL